MTVKGRRLSSIDRPTTPGSRLNRRAQYALTQHGDGGSEWRQIVAPGERPPVDRPDPKHVEKVARDDPRAFVGWCACAFEPDGDVDVAKRCEIHRRRGTIPIVRVVWIA